MECLSCHFNRRILRIWVNFADNDSLGAFLTIDDALRVRFYLVWSGVLEDLNKALNSVLDLGDVVLAQTS